MDAKQKQQKKDEEAQKPEELKEELERLQSEIEEWKAKYARALADYQNLERRTQEQKIDWIRQSNKNLILKLLPVLGTLMLAQKHLKDNGLELSIKEFLKVFEQEGAERIQTVGKDFDPLVMECVATKQGEDWKVLEEARPGYKIGDIVLQPAQVIVGKK